MEIRGAQTDIGRRVDDRHAEMFGGESGIGRASGEPMHFDDEGFPCTLGRMVEIVETDLRWVGYDIGRGYVVSSFYEGMRGFGFSSVPHTFRHVVYRSNRPSVPIIETYTPNRALAEGLHLMLRLQYIAPSKWVRRRGKYRLQRDGSRRGGPAYEAVMRRLRLRRLPPLPTQRSDGTWHWPSMKPWKRAR